jgi:hypothetical protein
MLSNKDSIDYLHGQSDKASIGYLYGQSVGYLYGQSVGYLYGQSSISSVDNTRINLLRFTA